MIHLGSGHVPPVDLDPLDEDQHSRDVQNSLQEVLLILPKVLT